mgnify:CR=1 FL=1
MNEQNPRQLQGIADLLATRGRYGDSMMVHMNPVEVQGLASMSPTGSLTINPDTGQPEAFLPFLAPLLGGMLGSAGLTGLGAGIFGAAGLSSAAAGAIGSGLTTAIIEGDLKKGLLSGITGFGIGSALGGLGDAISSGVDSGAAEILKGSADAVVDAGVNTAVDAGVNTAVDAGANLATETAKNISAEPLRNLSPENLALVDSFTDMGLNQAAVINATNPVIAPNVGPSLGQVFSKEGLGALTSMPTLAAVGIGEGTNEQIRVDEMMQGLAKDQLREKEQDYKSSVAKRDASYFPGYQKPYGDNYTQYASSGGIVSLDPSDFKRRMDELQQLGRPVKKMDVGGFIPNIDFSRLGKEPATVSQGGLRDPFSISPEQLQQTYQDQGLPGFGPEIMYFTPEKGKDPNPFEGWTPDPVIPEYKGTQAEITKAKMIDWYDGISPHPGRPPESESEKSFYNFLKSLEDKTGSDRTNLINQYNKGLESAGTATTTTPATAAAAAAAGTGTAKTASTGNLTADDYADLYGKYMNYDFNFAEGGGIQDLGGEGQANQEADRLIELTSMAILGNLPEEESEVVIQAFIEEFGDEAFQMLRDQTLETVVPGSQKEGEIVGSGGGMDDQIMGMIGNQQPVAVSPGEYIVPADVVSGLGDGSTDAGVQELDGMLDRVRVERTNTTQQPAPLRKGGVLPR